MVIGVMLWLRKPYEHRREHREHKCLYKCHQKLQKVNKYSKNYRHECHCSTNNCIYSHGYEYYTDECQYNSVPGKDIRKKPNH